MLGGADDASDVEERIKNGVGRGWSTVVAVCKSTSMSQFRAGGSKRQIRAATGLNTSRQAPRISAECTCHRDTDI